MSETKPTAGATRAAKALHLAGYTSFAGESAEVRIAEIIDREAGGWIQKAARPKVEELVELILAACRNPIMLGGEEVAVISYGIKTKAREVSAALGGKAE